MIVYCLAGRALDQGHWHTEAQRVEDLMTDLPSPADREAGSEGSHRVIISLAWRRHILVYGRGPEVSQI
jgi:hypothetical protein